MRLIHAHIDNFGTLHHFDIDFNCGINNIFHENGWGKTTLVTFIKVMFYGFDNDGKRNDIENERRHYTPWQNGTYGGTLSFELHDKQYRIERVFTSKNHDSFELYDVATNLPTKDYSSNIGEEIFGIDMKSFANTVFIGQQQVGSTEPTSQISAKIGNLSNETADMSMYEPANNALTKKLLSLTPKRNTGLLAKLEPQITELKYQVDQKTVIENNYSEQNAKIQECNKELESINKQLRSVNEKRNILSEYLNVGTKKEQYNGLKKELEDAAKELAETKKLFQKEVPTQDDIARFSKDANDYTLVSAEVKNAVLKDDEVAQYESLKKKFENGTPTQDELNITEQDIKKLSAFRKDMEIGKPTNEELRQLEQMKTSFRNGTPNTSTVDQLIDDCQKMNGIQQALPGNKANLETQIFNIENAASNQSKKSAPNMVLIIIGVLAVVAGIAIYLAAKNPAGFAGVAVGAVLLIAGVMAGNKKEAEPEKKPELPESVKALKEKIEHEEMFLKQKEKEITEFVTAYGSVPRQDKLLNQLYDLKTASIKYNELNKKVSAYNQKNYEDAVEKTVQGIEAVFEEYGIKCAEDRFEAELYHLESDIKTYVALGNKAATQNAIEEKYRKARSAINEWVAKYSDNSETDPLTLVSDLRKNLGILQTKEESFEKRKKQLSLFEADNDVASFEALKAPEFDETMEELTVSAKSLDERKTELQEIRNVVQNQIKELEEKLESISQAEDTYQAKLDERNTLQHQYEIVEKTQEYLAKAKDSFLAHYMQPMQTAFDKYYTLLTGDESNAYDLDANLNVTKVAEGAHRDIGLLSEGYKDLVGLCRRMAMIDAMYEGEKPFIIFDDPFVNFDNEKTEYGIKFINELSKKNQIIYMTCHNSRKA